MIISEAFGLLSYTEIEEQLIDENKAIEELNYYRQHANNKTHCQINYEKLLFIENQFSDNKKIQDLIIQLKKQIIKNYLLKEKLKKRIALQKIEQ